MTIERDNPDLSGLAQKTAAIVAVASAFVLSLAILWVASQAFVALGVGIVLAVVLDAGARGLWHILPLPRVVRLLIVVLLGALTIAAGLWWSGSTLLSQLNDFLFSLNNLIDQLQNFAKNSKLLPGDKGLLSVMPDPATILGGATSVLPQAFNAFSVAVAILFIAPFLAAEPATYKGIVLSLIPKSKRRRVDEVLDDAASAMRRWLFGQSISMLVIFLFSLCSLLAIGMPYAILLAVQAGLLTFIPTLGAFVAGVVILLAGLSQSPLMALYGLLVYLGVQFLESNLITPIVQERTVKLPPAATLTLQLVAGLLFGLLGLAFIVPLSAAIKQIVQDLYVDDCLGGSWNSDDDTANSRLGSWINSALAAVSGQPRQGTDKRS